MCFEYCDASPINALTHSQNGRNKVDPFPLLPTFAFAHLHLPTMTSTTQQVMSQTQEDSVNISKILNYWFRTSFPPPEDSPFRSWWFHATPEQDAEMRTTFEALWYKAIHDEPLRTRWCATRAGKMALLILFDQLPRNMFRGYAKMFATDWLSLPLAKGMVNDDLTAIEKMFVFTAIQHAEDIECAKMAEEGLRNLVKSMANEKRQRKYMKLLPAAKQHTNMLETFGRYCHRNELIGRPSTEEEIKYLMNKSNNFIKSVKKSKPIVTTTIPKDVIPLPRMVSPIRPMRILLLHGLRQNATVMRDAMKPMIRALKPYPIEFVSLNSPMVYRPRTACCGESQIASHNRTPILAEHLRCWWNASDDGKEYDGWESSVRFVQQASRPHGQWDGIVAFSQGATLVSLLCALSQPHFTRFAVLISGSPSRAADHSWL